MSGHVLQVLATPSGGGAELLVRELNDRLTLYGFSSDAVGFSGSPLPSCASLGSLSPRSPVVIRRLRRFLLRLKAQHDQLIVHAHLIWPLLYVPLAARGLDIPLVFTEHNTWNGLRRAPWTSLIERLAYGRYCRVICISEGVRDALQPRLGRPPSPSLSVIHNGGRRFDLVERAGREGGLRLVSVGSLTRQKGFDVAIDAVARCGELVSEYRILGEGPLRDDLRGQITARGVADKVRLVGWSEHVEPHYAWADVMLVPSRWEGFGLSAAEAMSTGLPIIASDVPGLREVVGSGNIGAQLVHPGNASAWAAAIRRWAVDRRQLPALGRICHARAGAFSLDRMTQSYAELYRQVMEECGVG
ncbi:MAG: glycosyltransferase [Pseudomonadota bacterium]